MPNVNDIVITSLETITVFGVTSGEYLYTLDELQNAAISQSEDKTELTGKGGRKLSSLKRNKAVSISGANGMVSGGLLESQTGSSFENKATKVMWTDYITVDTTDGTETTYTAVGTAGAEIVNLYVRNSDGTLGAKLEQDSQVAAGKFTYNPTTKALVFHTDITTGTEIVAFYKRNITASVLENKSDVYSGKGAMYIDALGEDKCGNIYRVQFYIPKADFSGEFSFEMGDNQTIHNFSADALSGACGSSDSFWTYTVFGVDTADTPVA